MKRVLLLCVYLAASTFIGQKVEAAFRLEYAEGSTPQPGLRLPSNYEPHWVAVPKPLPPRPRYQAPTRLPVTHVTGRCYAESGTPPQSVLDREVGGNDYKPNTYNFQGSGANGCWQFMPGTWGGYKGYRNAADAPVSVQNERAKQVWAGGQGCKHWSAC